MTHFKNKILLSIHALLFSVVLVSAPAFAGSFKTILTLPTPAGCEVDCGIEKLVFHWTTAVASGQVSQNDVYSDLSNFSMDFFSATELVYSDQIIIGGVLQPLAGVTRTVSDSFWDFDLDTMTLKQFRNVGFDNVSGLSGVQYLATDSNSLTTDGIVAIFQYTEGLQTGRTDRVLLLQSTAEIAVLVSLDSTFGTGTLTLDTLTDTLWLDVLQAGPYSYDSLQTELAPDGVFEGYRLATRDEVIELWQHAGINTGPQGQFVPENLLPVQNLMGFVGLGATNGNLGAGNFFDFTAGHILSDPGTGGECNVQVATLSVDQDQDADSAPDLNMGRVGIGCVFSANNFSDHGAWLIFEPVKTGPWTGSGIGTNMPPTTTTVVNDGSDGPAVFSYTNNAPDQGGSGASGAWEFSTNALTGGTVDLSYHYQGFHAFFAVTASIEAFVTHGESTTTIPLVSAGPANCPPCSSPSAGFNYSGDVSLAVNPGDQFGFRMTGSNGDLNSLISGTLTVTLGLAVPVNSAPVAVGTIADQDLLWNESADISNLAVFFDDIDGDPLSFSTINSVEAIARP